MAYGAGRRLGVEDRGWGDPATPQDRVPHVLPAERVDRSVGAERLPGLRRLGWGERQSEHREPGDRAGERGEHDVERRGLGGVLRQLPRRVLLDEAVGAGGDLF